MSRTGYFSASLELVFCQRKWAVSTQSKKQIVSFLIMSVRMKIKQGGTWRLPGGLRRSGPGAV